MVFGRSYLFGIGLVTMLACGCTMRSSELQAVRTFSKSHSCPEDRIQATPAGGASFTERYAALHPLPAPPADVAADAGRLEVWRKANGGDLEWTKEYVVYRLNGCDQTNELACMCPGIFSGVKCINCDIQDMCNCQEVN